MTVFKAQLMDICINMLKKHPVRIVVLALISGLLLYKLCRQMGAEEPSPHEMPGCFALLVLVVECLQREAEVLQCLLD